MNVVLEDAIERAVADKQNNNLSMNFKLGKNGFTKMELSVLLF